MGSEKLTTAIAEQYLYYVTELGKEWRTNDEMGA